MQIYKGGDKVSSIGNKLVLSRNLRHLLSERGIERSQICKDLDIAYTTFADWYNGVKYPRIDKIEMMANYFGVPKSVLIEEHDDIPSNLIPARFHQVPLVGEIACGAPILAEENITDYVDVPEHILCDFALKCRGNSMIDLGVKDGDVVYIRSQPEVQNGQVAAVIVDGMEAEATLKKFYRYDNQIVLVPANDEDKPFVYTGEEMARVHVQGLAVGFTHVFEQ